MAAESDKRTPGDWFCDQYGHIYGPPILPLDKDLTSRHIAFRLPHVASLGKDSRPGDGSLLSAAPALLEALEECRKAMTAHNVPAGDPAWIKSEKAIARAKGE